MTIKITGRNLEITPSITSSVNSAFAKLNKKFPQIGSSVVLNEEIYALVRAAIIKKLGDHAVNYIANLEI